MATIMLTSWQAGLWTAGPPSKTPLGALTRMTNVQVMDEGTVETRPGSTSSVALANTVDGAYVAGMHFFKLASGAVYQNTSSISVTQSQFYNLRAEGMSTYGLANDLVFFPGAMKKYYSPTTATSNWGISVQPTAAVAALGAAGVLTGSYTYKLTFYSSTTKTESGPSAVSNTISPSSQQVTLTLPTTCADTQVDQIRVYRTLGGITGTWYLLTTVALAAGTYTDNTADSGLGTTISNYSISPPAANVAARYKSHMCLFDVSGYSRYGYASQGSTPELFSSQLYELLADAGDTIQYAGTLGDYLYVFGTIYIYIFQMSTAQLIQIAKLPTCSGTINGRTVSLGTSGFYYATNDGIYVMTGFTPVRMSENVDALFRGIDRGGLSTISDYTYTSGTFFGGRYHFTYLGADGQWHTIIFNEAKKRWKHYTGWKYTVRPATGAYPLVGLDSCVAKAQVQGTTTDAGTTYTSECGFALSGLPLTELNDLREFRICAQCSGTLTIGFYDNGTLVYSKALTSLAFADAYIRYGVSLGSYFIEPEIRISSTSAFTLKMFEATLYPVRRDILDYTRTQGVSPTEGG